MNGVFTLGTPKSNQEVFALANAHLDTAIALDKLMSGSSGPLLDLADDPADESIMKLGPDFQSVLWQKVRTMNAHWRDYDRLFTMPNP